jgi:predicted esterase
MAIPKLAIHARPVLAPGQNGIQEIARPTMRQIANDPKRAYWFIDPLIHTGKFTQLTGRQFAAPLLVSASAKSGRRENDREQPPPPPVIKPGSQSPQSAAASAHIEAPGLIVVLSSDGDAASAAGFWYDAASHGLDKQYYIAVISAPKWTENQQVTWLTGQDLKSFKQAKFSTETLISDVVKDVASIRKVDPNRVFLHGIGNGGSAAYVASLEEKSPFRGFYVLNATFRSSSLPPLERASGRRYLIQNSKDDHVNPYWTAEAAQKMLIKNGAIVKLDASTGYLGSQAPDAVMTQIKTSFDWLAAGK